MPAAGGWRWGEEGLATPPPAPLRFEGSSAGVGEEKAM